MRCVAGAGLLALVGCNQIFGISETRVYDAAPPEASILPTVQLNLQVARVIEAAPERGGGGPEPLPVFAPIAPAPQVRIATLDGAYGVDTTAYAADGKISYPTSYNAEPWRLEYTLSDGIPREVQWQPAEGRGHVTVPLFGRVERDPAPSNSGYDITPAGIVMPYAFPSVLTTGMWTEGQVDPPATAGDLTVHYDFARAQSLSGPRGRPEQERGDRALFVDSVVDDRGCRTARGAGDFAPDLPATGRAAVAPSWDTRTAQVEAATITVDFIERLDIALGKLSSPDVTGVTMIGPIPNILMPGLARSSAERLLPFPAMHVLVQCPYTAFPPPSVLSPSFLEKFQFVAHIQLARTRTVADLDLTLSSGMAAVLLGTRQPSRLRFDVGFPASIPTQFVLAPVDGTPVDLSGSDDHVVVGPAASAFTFSFTPESNPDPDVGVDYYDVVLHRIVSTALSTQLKTERIYTVTQTSVRIDSTVLVPSAEYVFEVRAYKGHPDANKGDFSSVGYPYGEAIVFTRTFKTS